MTMRDNGRGLGSSLLRLQGEQQVGAAELTAAGWRG
jgi:hypothetical protein